VFNLSIAASSVTDTVRSRSHRGSTEIINLHANVILMALGMMDELSGSSSWFLSDPDAIIVVR
jgi:hypothetical protein